MAPGMEIEVALRSYELPFIWPDAVLDEINDLKAAFSKGLKGGFLVMTGYGKEEEKKLDQVPRKNFIVKTASSINKIKITF